MSNAASFQLYLNSFSISDNTANAVPLILNFNADKVTQNFRDNHIKKSNNTYATYLGSLQNAVNYQIIRHNGASTNYNFYSENLRYTKRSHRPDYEGVRVYVRMCNSSLLLRYFRL